MRRFSEMPNCFTSSYVDSLPRIVMYGSDKETSEEITSFFEEQKDTVHEVSFRELNSYLSEHEKEDLLWMVWLDETSNEVLDILRQYDHRFPFMFMGSVEESEENLKRLESFFMIFTCPECFDRDVLRRDLNQLWQNWIWVKRNRSQSEILLNALLKESTDSVYFKDLESRFLKVSRAMTKWVGLKESELIGKTDFDLFTAEHAQQAFDDERRIIKTGNGFSKVEKETWVDREDTWVTSAKFPLKDGEGKIVGTFGVSRNITDSMSTQNELIKKTQELKKSEMSLIKSNRELEEFAYVASHDLQEPLRKISAFGNRLKSKIYDKLEDKEKDYLDRMLGSSQRMSNLINDLLKYSRVGTRGRELVELSLNDVIGEVLLDLEFAVEQSGAKITVDDFPSMIGDATQLRQLFQNLIGNALKFKKQEVEPVISIVLKNKNSKTFVVEVRDNGIGFETEHSGKIFKVFQRLHSQSEYKGSGIGLSICKKIVERHKGEIKASGKPDEGAVFSITFPLSESNSG